MNQKVDGERMKKGYKEKRFAIGVIYHIFTFCFACVMIYPLVWMVLSSFKDTNEIIRTASELIPRHFSLENYKVGWQGFAGYNFGTFFKNSFVIAGLSTIGAVASSAVGVYTLVETAKANGLAPMKYIKYILSDMPGSAFLEHPEYLDDYLPWNPLVKEFCR